MGRFLTTLPSNLGFYNLGTVEAYPTGGSGPTAYGPTSYFGSDPLPSVLGDSVYNAADLGNFDVLFKSITLSNTHGGKSRIQSSFYKITLNKPRTIFVSQNYSPTSYQANTNRNTIISAYIVEDGTHRRELPINDQGYICKEASITEGDSDLTSNGYQADYPSQQLDPGNYIILITNDIRYLETTYSFTINSALSDWRYVVEGAIETPSFGPISESTGERLDFGTLTTTSKTYPYSFTSGLGYTREGVSP